MNNTIAERAREMPPSLSREPLPCPFCGAPGEIVKLGSVHQRVAARCSDLHCGGKNRLAFTEDEALALWNTRALSSTPPPAGDVEGVKRARDALQAMMDAWLDYHDAHSLTEPVSGRSDRAFDLALAARDGLDEILSAMPTNGGWREAIEAAAKVADAWAKTEPESGPHAAMIATVINHAAEQIAAAIRALPSPPGTDPSTGGD